MPFTPAVSIGQFVLFDLFSSPQTSSRPCQQIDEIASLISLARLIRLPTNTRIHPPNVSHTQLIMKKIEFEEQRNLPRNSSPAPHIRFSEPTMAPILLDHKKGKSGCPFPHAGRQTGAGSSSFPLTIQDTNRLHCIHTGLRRIIPPVEECGHSLPRLKGHLPLSKRTTGFNHEHPRTGL